MRYETMQERAAKGLDPLSGRPMETQGMIRLTRGKTVDETGREVTLSEHGDWVYAECAS